MKLLDVVEGWTGELGPFTLKVDGVPIDLNGIDVALQLRPQARPGLFVDAEGDVRVDLLASGQVYYKPDAADLRAADSPYTIRWKLTDGADDVIYVPSGEADTIVVHLP